MDTKVSILLGSTISDGIDENAVAEQLAKISEQLAIKNRRNRKIWKTIGIILLIMVLFTILLVIFNMPVSKSISTENSTSFIEKNN